MNVACAVRDNWKNGITLVMQAQRCPCKDLGHFLQVQCWRLPLDIPKKTSQALFSQYAFMGFPHQVCVLGGGVAFLYTPRKQFSSSEANWVSSILTLSTWSVRSYKSVPTSDAADQPDINCGFHEFVFGLTNLLEWLVKLREMCLLGYYKEYRKIPDEEEVG